MARAQEIYNFAYLWSREKGQKCVQLDMATAMWRLLFSAQPWPLCDAWCAFLEKHHGRAISRDTWVQLLDFVRVRSGLHVLIGSQRQKLWTVSMESALLLRPVL